MKVSVRPTVAMAEDPQFAYKKDVYYGKCGFHDQFQNHGNGQ
jgi:hypothetical protein